MTIVFENYATKIQKQGIFDHEFRQFCFLGEVLQLKKFQCAEINMGIVFQNFSPIIPR